MNAKTVFIARSAVIAALYAALTMLVYPIAYGPVQFRVSEALAVLPLFYAEAIPGLYIGCMLANIAGGPMDMLLGGAATLLAAILTYRSRKLFPGVLPPIIVNALLVPVIFLTIPDIETGYFVNVLTVGAGQLAAVAGLGVPLYFALRSAIKNYAALRPRFGRYKL
jgi:uncharacterized membrane protein